MKTVAVMMGVYLWTVIYMLLSLNTFSWQQDLFVLLTTFCVAAKPIDLLARYISAEDDDIAIEMHEPYTYLNVCMLQSILNNYISLQCLCFTVYSYCALHISYHC